MLITVAVMRVDVFQISEDRFGAISLRMISRNNARDLFFVSTLSGILVIQEERIVVPVGDHPPAVVLGNDMNDTILQFEGEAMILAVVLHLASFYSGL